MQQTSDGGFILIGDTPSNDGDVIYNYGYHTSAIWILKTNTVGDTLWTKVYGGSSYDEGKSIQQTKDGGYLAIGRAYSTDYDLTGRDPEKGNWVLKLDPNGDKEWFSFISGNYLYNFAQTFDEGYIFGGLSSDDSGHGNDDFFLAKLDKDGVFQWSKLYGGSREDWCRNIIQTIDSGFLLVGHTNSNDGNVLYNHSESGDIWIIKTDKKGDIMWQKSLGGTDNDFASSVLQKADSSFLILCDVNSNDGDVVGSLGNQDFWLVHLDKDGVNILSSKNYGGTSTDRPYAISPTSDGGYLMCGNTYSNDLDVIGQHGNGDFFVLKIDENYDVVWTKTLGGTEFDVAVAVKETDDGGVIVAGQTASWNGDVTNNKGARDYWLVKLQTTSTGIDHSSFMETIVVSPNPANDWISLDFPQGFYPLRLDVSTITGRKVLQFEQLDQSFNQLDISSLSKGVYLLTITSENEQKTLKIVKQ
ncbi:MAG: T9SS type A sorting domain-containing protein [Bacteroidales bacterium]|nr:T9SS type A sorting domain-containing protein [Bacteroidales bacterium]